MVMVGPRRERRQQGHNDHRCEDRNGPDDQARKAGVAVGSIGSDHGGGDLSAGLLVGFAIAHGFAEVRGGSGLDRAARGSALCG